VHTQLAAVDGNAVLEQRLWIPANSGIVMALFAAPDNNQVASRRLPNGKQFPILTIDAGNEASLVFCSHKEATLPTTEDERRMLDKAPKESIELRPDGWDRFEQAVDAAAKSGPKHREPVRHKPVEKPE
jgi:hypothetical protein